ECFNQSILEVMETDPDPFGFNTLSYISSAEDSKKLNHITKPCIIISASGMMEAGRVKHHLAHSISNPKNTVLAVGYCAPATLGAKILRGDKQVSIHGNLYEVNADIRRIDSYSGHGDYREMLQFLGCQDASRIARSFIVHGEIESQEFYRKKMMENGFSSPDIPARGDEYEI
ncbi:MAG TPA: MBL fold metallo-hydrolase RNA specificity domain-containing protein, partial [Bacteroidales bacterium]|nr:MBL fold metallo-hydrolase RNA specificity domain-containing protein [Bacteroidales bacterium]